MAFLFPSQVQNFGAEDDPALREVSNVEQQERPAKRQNTGGAGSTTEDFDDLVRNPGVILTTRHDLRIKPRPIHKLDMPLPHTHKHITHANQPVAKVLPATPPPAPEPNRPPRTWHA
jgi:hypothetical protein